MSPAPHDSLRRDLLALVGDGRVSMNAADRVAYARDLWPREQIRSRSGTPAPHPPAIIVWPSSTEDVVRVVAFAAERGLPLVPFGAGSGVCGGISPTAQTIILDLKRMRSVESIDRDRLTVTAQSGILGQHLEDQLLHAGFTLGHYPSSIYCSTLGGWIAGRSAGQCSGRYGKIEDMILELECVDGRGQVHRGVRGGSNGALLPLVTGSEGILAVVTRATLQISPAPKARVFASFVFDDTESGLHTIRDLYQSGLRPAVARLYDPFDTLIGGKAREIKAEKSKTLAGDADPGDTRPGLGTRALLAALRQPGALNRLVHAMPTSLLGGGALLVLMWEDDERIARAELAEAMQCALLRGGQSSGEAPARRWFEHRHSVSYRQSPIFAGGGFADTMEISAPWSKLWGVHEAVRRAVAPFAFVMAHFSHAYPDGGSIYFTFA
ncbi:MAG: FAD-binding oxidoreductase, partial [Myxococcales bacterium]|nr:FAD-binding oxidoreductase [Myxococcales bacterium]